MMVASGVAVSRRPTLPLITRKFARQSYAAIQAQRNAVFYSLRGPAHLGSIPIACSILTQRNAGLQDWGQDIDPTGKSWEIGAEGVVVSWPHVSPRCPEIHPYSHTQQFTKMNFVI